MVSSLKVEMSNHSWTFWCSVSKHLELISQICCVGSQKM